MKLKIAQVFIILMAGLISATAGQAVRFNQTAGRVRSADVPLESSNVILYRAGDEKGSGEVLLGSAVTDANGYFTISYAPQEKQAVLYLIASGPLETTRLAMVLGNEPIPQQVTINERTTIATAYTMAQFIVEDAIGGNSTGLKNASGTFRNLVDLRTGEIGAVLGKSPNGPDTSTMRIFNSLANLLAGCVSQLGDCVALFELTTPPGGEAPHNTLEAAVNIAHYSWQNSAKLFLLSLLVAPYQPAMTVPPVTWTLAIKYVGNGHEFDGPGAMAFDENGDVWVSMNYQARRDHSLPSCANDRLTKLTATGEDAPGAPYPGRKGGLSGVGFGITLDPSGDVWLGNFGFFGSTCPPDRLPPANSVSKFSPEGEVLSPRTGFTQGCISSAQGTVSDQEGNIWIANTCGGTVTQYRHGNPNDFWVFDTLAGHLIDPDSCTLCPGSKPFDIAIDAGGNAWITDNETYSALKLSSDGALLASVGGPDTGVLKAPLGVAIDSLGNVWVANSGFVPIPCATCGASQDYGDLDPDLDNASVTQIDPNGVPVGSPYKGGGIFIPWGVAVDGNDNVWVANFGGRRVTELCGARSETCPPGDVTGDGIAPLGYHSDALQRNTGVSIDPSGNVWLTNNWLIDPIQTNPGGDGLVVFIGLAAPVKTPLLGPPQQP